MTKRPRGRPVGSDGAATRERLLHSAREVFSERGYAKATPAAVAEGAGVSRTAFYRYWSSKAELYRALIDDMNTSVVHAMFTASEIDDPIARVTALFRAAAEFNADDQSYGRFLTSLIVEGHRDPEVAGLAQAEIERFRQFFADAVAEAHAAGLVTGDPDATADLLVSVLWGLGLFAGFIGDSARVERAIAATLEVFDRSVTS